VRTLFSDQQARLCLRGDSLSLNRGFRCDFGVIFSHFPPFTIRLTLDCPEDIFERFTGNRQFPIWKIIFREWTRR
jgi:hypothetical protein